MNFEPFINEPIARPKILMEAKSSLNNGTTERHVPNDFLQKMYRKKMFNLRWELSVPEKCCCLPLRCGFFVLAYVKLVLSVVLFLGILQLLLLMYKIFSREEMWNHGVAWTAMCIDVVDIVFGVIVIVSAYKKNVILMEMYYKCSIFVFGLLSIMCCFVFHSMYGNIYALLIIIILFILIILMQVYLNQIVKSEVLKLKSTSQFQILKNDEESFCTYINNDY